MPILILLTVNNYSSFMKEFDKNCYIKIKQKDGSDTEATKGYNEIVQNPEHTTHIVCSTLGSFTRQFSNCLRSNINERYKKKS